MKFHQNHAAFRSLWERLHGAVQGCSSSRPVLRHRIIMKPEADLEGLTPDHVLEDVLRAVEVPK
jgi:hypothetical protein